MDKKQLEELESLREENKRLRDVEAENERLRGRVSTLETENAVLRGEPVVSEPEAVTPFYSTMLRLNSGYQMPAIGFSTWMCNRLEAHHILKSAVHNGFRHLDFEFIYEGNKMIGEALREVFQTKGMERGAFFITNKVWSTFHSRSAALANIDSILEQLGLEYLDLCLIQWPVGYKEGAELFPKDETGNSLLSEVDFLETWGALEESVNNGKVRSIGLCDFNSDQIKRILVNCKIQPSVLQAECHAFFQQRKLRDFCKNNDILFVASCPLGSSADYIFPQTDYPKILENPMISAIAALLKKSTTQVALRFLIQLGIGVVPMASESQTQRDILDIFEFELNDQQMALMEKLDTGRRIGCHPDDAHSAYFPFGANCPDDRG